MSDKEAVKDTLCSYYEAVRDQRFDDLPELFDDAMTGISLYGSQTVIGGQAIIELFRSMVANWKEQGISPRMGHDREKFRVTDVQENIKLVQTRLTNFDFDDNPLSSWDCTYVMVKKDNRWLVTLGTSNNRATTSLK